jgi:hypothetical protein
MENVAKLDYAVTSQIVKECLEQLDLESKITTNDRERKHINNMGFLISANFLCGLRGEEIMKINLGGLIKYLEAGGSHMECPSCQCSIVGKIEG